MYTKSHQLLDRDLTGPYLTEYRARARVRADREVASRFAGGRHPSVPKLVKGFISSMAKQYNPTLGYCCACSKLT